MAPIKKLVVLSQTGIHFPCPKISWPDIEPCALWTPNLKPRIFLFCIQVINCCPKFEEKSTLVKRTKLKTHLGVISDLLCTLYIWPTRSLLRICAINFWARESASWNWFIITPLPGQNRHYQVKTGISGWSRIATSQDKSTHTKQKVGTVHNPQLSEQLRSLSFSLFAHPDDPCAIRQA